MVSIGLQSALIYIITRKLIAQKIDIQSKRYSSEIYIKVLKTTI